MERNNNVQSSIGKSQKCLFEEVKEEKKNRNTRRRSQRENRIAEGLIAMGEKEKEPRRRSRDKT